MEWRKTTLSSNGKLVYVGNADRNGVNVNNTKPDNRNDNLGVVSLRSHSRNTNKQVYYLFVLL